MKPKRPSDYPWPVTAHHASFIEDFNNAMDSRPITPTTASNSVMTTSPAKTPRTDAAWAASFSPERANFSVRDECEKLETELARLRAEVERLKKQIKDDNRAYGCELRDPNGTIWEQAAKDYARAEKAEAALAEAKVERETVAEASLRSLESYIDKLKQFAERAEKAEAECLEQARLLGKSGEREADLLGKIDRLNRVIERASVQFFHEGTDGETAAKMLNVLNETK